MLLDWNVSRFRPSQYLVDIVRFATKLEVQEKDALDFTVEGATVRVFINLVEKNPNAGPDLSDKF